MLLDTHPLQPALTVLDAALQRVCKPSPPPAQNTPCTVHIGRVQASDATASPLEYPMLHSVKAAAAQP
jgi:hypothetical protein